MKNLQKAGSEIRRLQEQAVILHRNGKLGEAEKIYRNILAVEPNPRDAGNLGSLLRATGRLKEAVTHYESWINKYPEDLILRMNAINSGIEFGDTKICQRWVKEGKKYHKNRWEIEWAEAQAELLSDNNDNAIRILKKIGKESEDNTGVLLDLSKAYLKISNIAKAENILGRVLEIEPNNLNAIHNLLRVYTTTMEVEKFRKLLYNLPTKIKENTKILRAEGDLFIELKKYEDALIIFSKLCRTEPEIAMNWVNLCACLKGTRNIVDAYISAKKGSILHPKDSLMRKSLIQLMVEQGKEEEAKKVFIKDVLSVRNQKLTKNEICNLQFLGNGYQLIGSDILKQLAQNWERQTLKNKPENIWGDCILESTNNRRLRIGYFSADFCNHPVGRFIYPLIKAHNRDSVKIIGLDCGSIIDEQNNRIKEICDEWHLISDKSSMNCARIISNLQLDIVIELGGFTANSRIDILLHRPCRIQLSYLGYFAPTYLNCIDGWVGDRILFDTLNKVDQQEKLIMITGGYMAFDKNNKQVISADMNRQSINIGCFNHSRKITRRTVLLYKDVLQEMESEYKLVLKSISFIDKKEQERVRMMFIKEGIKEEKIQILECAQNHEEHLRTYNLIDFVLDPIPYGGATTTCEALVMGVPVVCFSGKGMIGQLSASILYHADCKEWICKSKKDYIEKCKYLAKSGVRGNKQRLKLSKKVERSSLCNSNRLAMELESVFKTMSSNQCLN